MYRSTVNTFYRNAHLSLVTASLAQRWAAGALYSLPCYELVSAVCPGGCLSACHETKGINSQRSQTTKVRLLKMMHDFFLHSLSPALFDSEHYKTLINQIVPKFEKIIMNNLEQNCFFNTQKQKTKQNTGIIVVHGHLKLADEQTAPSIHFLPHMESEVYLPSNHLGRNGDNPSRKASAFLSRATYPVLSGVSRGIFFPGGASYQWNVRWTPHKGSVHLAS